VAAAGFSIRSEDLPLLLFGAGLVAGETPGRGGCGVFLPRPTRTAPATVRSRSGLTIAGRRPMRSASSPCVLPRTFAPRLARRL